MVLLAPCCGFSPVKRCGNQVNWYSNRIRYSKTTSTWAKQDSLVEDPKKKEYSQAWFQHFPFCSCILITESNAALANAALVLSSKNWKIYSTWGAASKNKSKKAWVCTFSLLPCRNRCRFSESDFLYAGAPTIENKIELKIQNTKVASAKVAFDIVRLISRGLKVEHL